MTGSYPRGHPLSRVHLAVDPHVDPSRFGERKVPTAEVLANARNLAFECLEPLGNRGYVSSPLCVLSEDLGGLVWGKKAVGKNIHVFTTSLKWVKYKLE